MYEFNFKRQNTCAKNILLIQIQKNLALCIVFGPSMTMIQCESDRFKEVTVMKDIILVRGIRIVTVTVIKLVTHMQLT